MPRNHFSLNFARPGSQSPPLPPPPPPEDEHQDFGRPRTSTGPQLAPIVPEDQNLPGWVPKNYIEKGKYQKMYLKLQLFYIFFHIFVFSGGYLWLLCRQGWRAQLPGKLGAVCAEEERRWLVGGCYGWCYRSVPGKLCWTMCLNTANGINNNNNMHYNADDNNLRILIIIIIQLQPQRTLLQLFH